MQKSLPLLGSTLWLIIMIHLNCRLLLIYMFNLLTALWFQCLTERSVWQPAAVSEIKTQKWISYIKSIPADRLRTFLISLLWRLSFLCWHLLLSFSFPNFVHLVPFNHVLLLTDESWGEQRAHRWHYWFWGLCSQVWVWSSDSPQ